MDYKKQKGRGITTLTPNFAGLSYCPLFQAFSLRPFLAISQRGSLEVQKRVTVTQSNTLSALSTVKPLYKHIIGNRIRMLIREVCLYRGNRLVGLKNL